jgi:hypothetical protein
VGQLKKNIRFLNISVIKRQVRLLIEKIINGHMSKTKKGEKTD